MSRLEGSATAETRVYEVFIRTHPQKLWQALPDGEITKRYFFGETVHSDWKAGSAWYSTGAGGERHVEGEVVESDPPRRLVVTWRVLYDPDLRVELSRVTCVVETRAVVCKVIASRGR